MVSYAPNMKTEMVFRKIFKSFILQIGDVVEFDAIFFTPFTRQTGTITNVDIRGLYYYVCLDVGFGKYKRVCRKGTIEDFKDMKIIGKDT